MTDLFVYGALMYKDVREALLGHDYETTEATLEGHTRKQTKDLPYPALVEEADEQVEGVLLRNVETHDLIILDKFHEDHQRTLKEVQVEEKKVYANTYEVKNVEILDEQWNEEDMDYVEFYLEHIIPAFFKGLNN